MAFPADDIFLGPANFGRLHSLDGIIWHSTEGGGWSRDAALATAKYQLTNPGSYNFIIYDGGVLLTVPYLEASGGINPFSSFWSPERFPFLAQMLNKPCPVAGCAGAYRNPTMHHVQISFSGRRNAMDAGLMPTNMIDTAVRLVAFLEDVAGKKLVHSGHMHWQSNRSDPGQLVFGQVSVPTLPDTSTMEESMLRFRAEGWRAGPNGARALGADGKVKYTFAAGTPLWSVAESLDGTKRYVAISSDDKYLMVVARSDLSPISPGGDPAFTQSIWDMLRSGKVVVDLSADLSAANARITKIKALSSNANAEIQKS